MAGETHRIRMDCGNIYITLNKKYGEPFEIICRVGKAGNCQGALLEGIGRLSSIALRSGVHKKTIIKTLREINCTGKPAGDPSATPASCLDALATILEKDE